MPLAVSIVPELPVMHMLYTGRAHIRELRAGIAEVYAHPEYRPGMTEICDLRGVTELDIGFDEMLRFAHESKSVHDARGLITDIYFIAPTHASHQMVEMFDLLSKTIGNNLRMHMVTGYPEIFAALDLPVEAMSHLPDGCETEEYLLNDRRK